MSNSKATPPLLGYQSGPEDNTSISLEVEAASGSEGSHFIIPTGLPRLRSGRQVHEVSNAGCTARSTSRTRGGRSRPYDKTATSSNPPASSSIHYLQWEDSPLSLVGPLEKTRLCSTTRQQSPETLHRAIEERAASALGSHNTTVVAATAPESQPPVVGTRSLHRPQPSRIWDRI